jgi:intein-encoded DNA endonuclease-like protein
MAIRKKYNQDFFKTWSSDMAYVLGFLYADGNISVGKRGNHYIAIYSADKYLLIAMARAFGSAHKISKRSFNTGAVYRIQIGSKTWVDDLLPLGACANKTKRLQLPLVPKVYMGDFVRGFFDGDGNVWVGIIHKTRQTTHATLQVQFTSASISFLRELQEMLKAYGVEGGSLYQPKSKSYGRIGFSMKDALTIYKIMYNGAHKLHLKRKKNVFDKFIKLRS